jgi:formate hydrogenlyase subunit 4
MSAWVITGEEIGLFALVAPFVIGAKEWIAARIQGRPAAPIWQSWLDLLKLLTRVRARPRPAPASWVFSVAPVVVFGSYLALGVVAPPLSGPIFDPLDLVAVAYLLGSARFMLALAGMDAGTPFGGMGGSREMFVNAIAEPVLFLVIVGLAQSPDGASRATTGLQGLFGTCTPAPGSTLGLVFALTLGGTALLVLAIVLLLEAGLLPFDNPGSHLEVPMIQKGLQLEYSGRQLGLIEWGEAMRLTFFLALLTGLLARGTPPGGLCLISKAASFSLTASAGFISGLGDAVPVIWFILKVLLGAGVLAIFEATRSRLALARITIPGLVAILVAAGAIFLTIGVLTGGDQ